MDSKNELLRQYATDGKLQLLEDLLARMTQEELQEATWSLFEAFVGAAKNGHLKVLSRLLEFHPVKNYIITYHNLAFRKAAANGHLDVLNKLLEFSEVVLSINANESYALWMAAENGHLDIVNRLLEFHEVRKNIINEYGSPALQNAVANGHWDIINRLLEVPEVVENIAALSNYFRHAAALGQLDFVNRLLEIPAVVNNIAANNSYALRLAATNGHLDVIKTLVKHWPENLIPEPLPTSNNEILETLILCEHARQYYILLLLATVKKGAKFNSELVRHVLDNFKVSGYSRFFANANEVLEDIAAAFLNKDLVLHTRCQQAFTSLVQTERKKVIFSMIFSEIVKSYPLLNALTQQQRAELNGALQSEFTAAFDSFVAKIGINEWQIYVTDQQGRKAISIITRQFTAMKKNLSPHVVVKEELKDEFKKDDFMEILNKSSVKRIIASKALTGRNRRPGIE